MTTGPFSQVEAALQNLKNGFLQWLASEEVVVESVATEIIAAVETVLTALKPSAIQDIQTILKSLPADFLSGASFDIIVEEVFKQASEDLKKIMDNAAPQVLEAIVGVLVNTLAKA